MLISSYLEVDSKIKILFYVGTSLLALLPTQSNESVLNDLYFKGISRNENRLDVCRSDYTGDWRQVNNCTSKRYDEDF